MTNTPRKSSGEIPVPSPNPGRAGRRIPVENLMRELERSIFLLSQSRRYRIGNFLGRIPGLLLFRPKPRLSMNHMLEIFSEYNSARSAQESIPPERLAGWIKELRNIFESFLASSRWKTGDRLVGILGGSLLHREEIPTVKHIRKLFYDHARGRYIIAGLEPERLIYGEDSPPGSEVRSGRADGGSRHGVTSKETIENALPATSVGYRWIKACRDCSGRDVCIFAAYLSVSHLQEYKRRYLAALKSEGFYIILTLSQDDLDRTPCTGNLDFVDAILVRENRGFDFAAWAQVMALAPSVWDAGLLLLANDSVFGPSASFKECIREIRESGADVTGLTESLEHEPHLQSYFLAFKGNALVSTPFRDYWNGIKAFPDKWDVIFNYEIRFTSFCRGTGLECRALFPVAPAARQTDDGVCNRLHISWKALVKEGFPFVKTELLRDNPVSADLENWEQYMLENGFSLRLVRHDIPAAFKRWFERKVSSLDTFHSSASTRRTPRGKYQWAAVSGRPSFFLDISGLPRGKPGWCAFSIMLETSNGGGEARFIFQSRGRETRDDPLHIEFENNKPVTRITRLENPLAALKFIPVNCQCRFTVRKIGYIQLNESQAEMRLLDFLIESEKYRSYASRSSLRAHLEKVALRQGMNLPDILLREYRSISRGFSGITYSDWMRRAESNEIVDLQRMHSESHSFVYKPLITVILAVSDPLQEAGLRQSAESVLSQSYPHWELCVAFGTSISSEAPAFLDGELAADFRIKLLSMGSDGCKSDLFNRALERAAGDFVVFLEPGESLSVQALYRFARKISEIPQASIVYSDDDRMDRNGARSDPEFKPDWNPDLFLSRDYIGHAVAVRRSLAVQAAGFREDLETCLLYDLILRCLPGLAPGRIVHIPRVLFHRSLGPDREVRNSFGKIDPEATGIRARKDYFNRIGSHGVTVEAGAKPGLFRVSFPVPDPEPLVSLVIPTRDKLDLLQNCVSSILNKTSYRNYEILIIDNQSRNRATLEWLDRIQEDNFSIRVIEFDLPFNYSTMCNLGVEKSRGSIIGLVNNDVEVVNSGWMEEMVSQVSRPEIGCVGAKLYFPEGTLQHVGVITGNSRIGEPWHIHYGEPGDFPGYLDQALSVRNYSAVTAAVMMVRKSVYLEAGSFEELNLAVALNDVDFCLKVKEAGYRNLWTPYAELVHHESRSRGYETTPEQKRRYAGEVKYLKNKWGEQVVSDPLFNVNLRLEDSKLSYAVPDLPGQ